MKKIIFTLALLSLCLIAFIACDPLYPPGNIRVEMPRYLSQGSSIDLEIIYPNTGGTIVFGWKDQHIEIIRGDNVVSVSGLTITGLQSGTATIKVSATTIISDEAADAGHQEKIYSTEVGISVR